MSDLAGMLARGEALPAGFATATVTAYDKSTGASTVDYRGTLVADLPLVDSDAVINLAVGDVVILMRLGSSWCILGRVLQPGDARFAGTAVGFGEFGVSGTNFALSTSYDAKASELLETPEWANRMMIHATAYATVENPTTANEFVYLRVAIGGAEYGSGYVAVGTAASGHPDKYGHVAASGSTEIAITGGDLYIVAAELKTTVGSWSSQTANVCTLRCTATFTKVV